MTRRWPGQSWKRRISSAFPTGGFEVGVTINTSAPGKEAETRKYRVLSKGNDNTIVMITEPASERGQMMLMKGRDLWVFLPNVSQPVRVPLSQRLTGQVANGDLARANFTGDYVPKLLRTETVEANRCTCWSCSRPIVA